MSSWSSQDRIKDTSDAAELAKRLIETVSEPIEVSGLSLTVGASVGVALALDGHEDPMQLLARADLAVNRAKQRGRGRVEQYDESLQRALLERADVEQALAVALRPDSDELVLHYQPLTRAETGTVLGVEALVRWNRPGHEQWRPDRFIPIAEASNLIIDLDRWVLSTAARQLAQWSAGGELESVYVAVNISGRHLVSGRRHPAGTGHSVAP
jgi:predicted signal transduction protein with EAL and GGDEF domain